MSIKSEKRRGGKEADRLEWELCFCNFSVFLMGKSAGKSKIDFAVGGQALIEGVMMRSPHHIVVALNKKDGSIKTRTEKFRSFSEKVKIFKWPILRGMLSLVEMMVVGFRMLNYSADEWLIEEGAKERTTKKKARQKVGEVIGMLVMLVLGMGLALFIFKFLPLWLTSGLSTVSPVVEKNWILFNFIDGVIKVSLFVAYIALISLMPDIKRVFQYHGAEHKAVFTYEKGLVLEEAAAAKESRFHPRCGTSFIFVVILISIAVYTFLPKEHDFWLKLMERIAFLPVIAGISYEALKLSAKFKENWLMKVLIAPGLWLQRLTTREPSKRQLKVALKALETALEKEKG